MGNDIRHWIKLISEAAAPGGATYWLYPKTGQIIPASDHGQAVIDHPDAFGIDYTVQQQMDAAFPESAEYDDEGEDAETDPTPHESSDFPAELWGNKDGWNRNDAWEVLAMNRGWVRIGEGTTISATYLSSSTAAAVWAAVRYLVKKYGSLPKVEVEIARPHNQIYTSLVGDDLTAFLDAGARKANAFLMMR